MKKSNILVGFYNIFLIIAIIAPLFDNDLIVTTVFFSCALLVGLFIIPGIKTTVIPLLVITVAAGLYFGYASVTNTSSDLAIFGEGLLAIGLALILLVYTLVKLVINIVVKKLRKVS